MFSLFALAAATISYTEPFEPGRDVDVNQAFYVCQQGEPETLMEKLVAIKDTAARRAFAGKRGCVFHMSSQPSPIYKVVKVRTSICLDRQRYTEAGQQMIGCGREGHVIDLERFGESATVIWLSLDTDYD